MSWKSNVISSFDSNSDSYDKNCDLQKDISRRLAADLPKTGISDILEIGCGTGNLTAELLKLYPSQNLCITDIAPAMLNRAKAKFPNTNVNWQIFDGESIQGVQKYDLIVANMVFQWFEDIDATLERLQGMLKPNGSIFYTMPAAQSFKEWKSVLNELDLPVGIIEFAAQSNSYRSEDISYKYSNAMDFLRSIKGIGAGQPRKNYTPLSVSQMRQACALFDEKYAGKITWQIMFGHVKSED